MCSGRDYFGKESIFGEGMEFGMRKEKIGEEYRKWNNGGGR